MQRVLICAFSPLDLLRRDAIHPATRVKIESKSELPRGAPKVKVRRGFERPISSDFGARRARPACATVSSLIGARGPRQPGKKDSTRLLTWPESLGTSLFRGQVADCFSGCSGWKSGLEIPFRSSAGLCEAVADAKAHASLFDSSVIHYCNTDLPF